MSLNHALKIDFLAFAKTAKAYLHIKTRTDYEKTLKLIEELREEVGEDSQHPLNDLIDLFSQAIERFELQDSELLKFHRQSDKTGADVAMLRVLMEQHQLGVADFPEIGDKSLVSKILSGQRNLTKKHIQKISERFNIEPGLFF